MRRIFWALVCLLALAGPAAAQQVTTIHVTDAVSGADVDNLGDDATNAIRVLPIGTVTVTGAGGTFPITAASLPLPSGASTSAKQPALGTAGSASSDVITIQGIASMTAVKVDGSAVTQPVSFSDTAFRVLGSDTYTEATSRGIVVGGVRRDADTTMANTDNEFAPFSFNATGSLKVACIVGCSSSGGSSIPDDSAFTVGSTSLTVAGGTYRSTRDSVDDNDGGAFAMTIKRALYTTIETALGDSAVDETADAVKMLLVTSAGVAATLSTDYTHDAALTIGSSSGPLMMGRASAAAPTDVSTDNDAVALWARKDGALVTALSYAGGGLVTGSGGSINVICTSGCSSSGGSSITDDAAFTVGSTAFTVAGGTYRSVRDSVDDNDGGGFAMTQKRGLYVSPESPNGDSIVDETNDALKVVNATASLLNMTAVGTTAHDGTYPGTGLFPAGLYASSSQHGLSLPADGDITRALAGLDGAQITRPHTNLESLMNAVPVSVTDTTSTLVASAAGSGVKWYVSGVACSNTSASTMVNVNVQDGVSGTTRLTVPCPPGGGIFNPPVPIGGFTANTAVAIQASTSASTVTVTVYGFKSKL